jgi:hypothetical protein
MARTCVGSMRFQVQLMLQLACLLGCLLGTMGQVYDDGTRPPGTLLLNMLIKNEAEVLQAHNYAAALSILISLERTHISPCVNAFMFSFEEHDPNQLY